MDMHDHLHHHHDDDHDHGAAEAMDPAQKSMADALRVSFRLLSLFMVVLVLLFLVTGVKRIQIGKVGIKSVFGRITGLAQPGLACTWPFPVGNIEEISIAEQTIAIGDFWMNESPGDQLVDLDKRSAPQGGLRPGWDGALVTGDTYVLHAEFECAFKVLAPLLYKKNVVDANEVIRAAVCAAAIRAAATRTADGLMSTEKADFKSEIQREAQKRLDAFDSGIELTAVRLGRVTWPLRALPEYYEAQRASQEAGQLEDIARKDAAKILRDAAGVNYRMLVGEPGQPADPNENLIGNYDAARRGGDANRAADLLLEIDQTLLSEATGGEASKILSEARAYRTNTIQSVESRVDQFTKLLPEYLKAPQYMLDSLWASTREEILSSPTVVKWMIPPGKRTVVQLNTPPELNKAIQWEQLKDPNKK